MFCEIDLIFFNRELYFNPLTLTKMTFKQYHTNVKCCRTQNIGKPRGLTLTWLKKQTFIIWRELMNPRLDFWNLKKTWCRFMLRVKYTFHKCTVRNASRLFKTMWKVVNVIVVVCFQTVIIFMFMNMKQTFFIIKENGIRK